MSGVEILAMEEVVVDTVFNWKVAIITFSVLFIVLVLVGLFISFASKDWNNITVGIILGLILGVFGGIVGGSAEKIPTEYETRYKVIISDEILMNDFVEKYKIIEQDGRIYTVAERK